MTLKAGKIRSKTKEKAKDLLGRIDRPIAMVGMMGAGKSRIGRLLAQTLELPFYDTDSDIESAAGCSVAEIFSRFGEKVFREAEVKTMRRLLDAGPCVIATGGGTLMNEGMAERVRGKALSLWLRADPQVILARVDPASRPLLAGGDPAAIVQDLMEKRAAVYARADLVVDVHDVPVEQTLYDVLEKIHARLV